jgi:competence protein ComFB
MALLDSYDFELLKNEAEVMVLKELNRQLENYPEEELCLCNECVVDMAAVALNSIRPLYRFSLLGSLYAARAMDEQDYAEGIKGAVANAIEKVRLNPSHD